MYLFETINRLIVLFSGELPTALFNIESLHSLSLA